MSVTRSKAPGLAPLLAALALTGCAGSYGAPINGERALSPEEQRLQAVENKTVDLSRRLDAMASGNQSGASMGDDLRSLRGEVEQLRHDVDTLQQQSQQQYSDADARLKRLEAAAAPAAPPGQVPPGAVVAPPAAGQMPPPALSAAAAPPVPAAVPPPAAAAPAAPAAAAPSSAGADEEAIYLKSVDQLRANKLDEAIRGFHTQLTKYPQGSYADNAMYWTGQAYYIKQSFPEALKAYQGLLQQFPASPKVPEALLRVGVIYQDQQKNDLARNTYQRVIQQFPNSTAASQARTRLAQIR